MSDSTAVIAVVWTRWGRSSPGYGAQASADCRTDASTTPTASDRTDDSPGAGADQAAAERAFAGIVRVCGGRRRQQQSGADHARYSRLPFHSLPTDTVQGRDLLGCRPSIKELCPSFPSVKNTNGQGCSSVPRLRGGRRRAGLRRSRAVRCGSLGRGYGRRWIGSSTSGFSRRCISGVREFTVEAKNLRRVIKTMDSSTPDWASIS